MNKESYEEMLSIRGVETPCRGCHGFGVKSYGNISTWKHGIGGQMITTGICDKCWGSGDANRKWTDLRVLQRKKKADEDEEQPEMHGDSYGDR